MSGGGGGGSAAAGGFRAHTGPRLFRRPQDDPPGTSRLFIAVPVADVVRTAVADLMAAVAGAPIDARAYGQPRWVSADNLHVTLRFLGATPDDLQPTVAAALEAAARGVSRFDVTLTGGGAFPDQFRPRVLWIGIAAGATELAALSVKLNGELGLRGWAPDDRPFQPHLTLARTDGVPGADVRAAALAAAAKDMRLSWQADALVLYRSILGHGPTRYESLAKASLAPV